jgi:hypothetical protein
MALHVLACNLTRVMHYGKRLLITRSGRGRCRGGARSKRPVEFSQNALLYAILR